MRVFAGVVVVAAVGVSALAVARIGPFADPVTLVVGDSVTNLSRIEMRMRLNPPGKKIAIGTVDNLLMIEGNDVT